MNQRGQGEASGEIRSGGVLSQFAWPLRTGELGLLAAICAVIALTSVVDAQHNYWHNPGDNLIQVINAALPQGIIALGAAVVIIAGGIDLSIGSVSAFSGTICAAILVLLCQTR